MTFRLLGLTDEQRLAIEETTGIKTEGVKLLFEAANEQTQQIAEQLIATAIKDVQSVVGPHGSVTRLQAGGVNISQGLGISVFESGVLKTTIEPDGDLLVGSDITQPSTTSFCVFVNEQVYNGETMGAGDLLIGDNSTSTSNVKYDASEGQLQFRLGTTVNVYMDTDGSLRAGAGAVILDSSGITINAGIAEENQLKWATTADPTHEAYISVNESSDMDIVILNDSAVEATLDLVAQSGAKQAGITLSATKAVESDLIMGADGVDITGTDTLFLNSPTVIKLFGPVVINENGLDQDIRIESDGDTNNLFSDGGTNRVGIGTGTPGHKLDVNGSVNVASGSTYKINGTDVISATATGRTEEEIQDIAGAMVTGNTETGITVTYQDADGTIDFELVDEYLQDTAGAMTTGNTETGITVTYQDSDGTIDFELHKLNFSAYRNGAQTINNGTFTKVQFETEEFDSDGCYDNATNYRFTPTKAGKYQVDACVSYQTAGGIAIALLYKNGARFKDGNTLANTALGTSSTISALVDMNGSSDYLEVFTYQNSGAGLGLNVGGVYLCFFQAFLIPGS